MYKSICWTGQVPRYISDAAPGTTRRRSSLIYPGIFGRHFQHLPGFPDHYFKMFLKELVLLAACIYCVACGQLWSKSYFRVSDIPSGDRSFGEENMAVVNNPSGGSSKVTRVYYPRRSYKPSASPRGGAQFFKRLSSPRELATLTYDIYFAENFDFVKGGKLPGMYGGSKTCSGGRDSSGCFSTRFMFRRNGDGEVYLYAPDNQASNFCSGSKIICNFNHGHSLGRGSFRFQTGRWYTISQRVKLNTVGKTDGYIKVLLNGSQVYYKSNVRLRNSNSVKIDGMFFSTFFGGSDSSWATPVNTYTYFRNFKMTT